MPSWFKKVFKNEAAKADTAVEEPAPKPVTAPPSAENSPLGPPDPAPYENERPAPRKLVQAPVLMPEEEQTGWSEEIRIKAKVEKDMLSCVFMVDRPVLDGYSAWFPSSQWAEAISPLAARLFQTKGVGSVLLHNFTVTITAADGNTRPWEDLAAEVGQTIREFLKSEKKVVTDEFVQSMPPEEEVRKRVQGCIDMEINPGIAAHSGSVSLERVEGNTVFITMGGGCQGCAASAITLRQGIHSAFRQAVPQIGAIYDETDHSAGTNPFFKELPAGMV